MKQKPKRVFVISIAIETYKSGNAQALIPKRADAIMLIKQTIMEPLAQLHLVRPVRLGLPNLPIHILAHLLIIPIKDSKGGHNYCRNPDNESNGAWCYTTSGTRWEFCDIPACSPPITTEPTNHPSPSPVTRQPVTSTPLPTIEPTPDSTGLPMCSVPELTSLAALTSDLRLVYQDANLPTITGGTTSSQPFSDECQTSLSKKKLLMIGIDGLRADVVGMTPLPNLHRLQSMGTWSYWANIQSTGAAVSGPGWASMFTGVELSKHKVDGNGDLTNIAYSTVHYMAKVSFNLSIAASVSWHPLISDIIDHEDPSTLSASYLRRMIIPWQPRLRNGSVMKHTILSL